MTIEIELKFIATTDAVAETRQKLTAFPHQHSSGKSLTNIYFETPDSQLRRWDMGLRIRGLGDRYEMTLKTAGQCVGSLQQRPEYNIPLTEPALDLTRLPPQVWPHDTDVEALQQQLSALFTTHFTRETWLVTYRQSEIEVACDQGEISAQQRSEPLCEVELELKSGERSDLLALAAELAAAGGLRLGSRSKAARGYDLAAGNPVRTVRPLTVLAVAAKASVADALSASLLLALNHWQFHEELWLEGNQAARQGIIDALDLLRQIFVLYGALIPRKASSELRQMLTATEQSLQQQAQEAAVLCTSAPWVQAQLALTDWVVTQRWQQYIDTKAATALQGSFKRFSDIMLGRVVADLKACFGKINQPNEYQDKLPRLRNQLLAVRLLAGASDAAAVTPWLAGWQQFQQYIVAGQDAWLDRQRREVLKQPAFWRNGTN